MTIRDYCFEASLLCAENIMETSLAVCIWLMMLQGLFAIVADRN
jgi:hypothetical protein